MTWIVAILIGGLVLGVVINAFKVQGAVDKFVGMGDIRGKPIATVIAVVGPPSSISAAGAGQTLYQWIETNTAGGYHYAILADGDEKAVGFTHQFRK